MSVKCTRLKSVVWRRKYKSVTRNSRQWRVSTMAWWRTFKRGIRICKAKSTKLRNSKSRISGCSKTCSKWRERTLYSKRMTRASGRNSCSESRKWSSKTTRCSREKTKSLKSKDSVASRTTRRTEQRRTLWPPASKKTSCVWTGARAS